MNILIGCNYAKISLLDVHSVITNKY